jgi:small subunit ribosomal protein S11
MTDKTEEPKESGAEQKNSTGAVDMASEQTPVETKAEAVVDKVAKPAEDSNTDAAVASKPSKKVSSTKGKRKFVIEGAAHVTESFNNTIVTITNSRGDVLAWSSAGACGFKGSKKGTPYAGQLAAAAAAKVVTDPKTGCGMERIKIYVNGFGASRDSVIRTLAASFKITALIDATSVPHNGCRNPKERRV